MTRLLIGALLTLASANAVADNIFIYESEDKQEPIANIDSEGNADKFTKEVKVTYYNKEGKLETKLQKGTSANYLNSTYDSLR
jgi:hypothetical protein